MTLLALSALPTVCPHPGFRLHGGYHPHLGKRTGHLPPRSVKKEAAGHLRRKSSKDVGPYLNKESFLHSSGFFGEGFMPNLPALVVRKREQATEKPVKKRPIKMGFPKMMLNSLMQRLNLPNMKQLLKGMQKSKPPKKGLVKGSDEYPYPFHSIQSNPPTKKAKGPLPIPPQKRPNGLLTPDFDRPFPLFVESPHDKDPLYYHQLSNSVDESPQSDQAAPSPAAWQTTRSPPHLPSPEATLPPPASHQRPPQSQPMLGGGFSQDHLQGAPQEHLPIPPAAISLTPTNAGVPITPFVHQPSLNHHQEQSFSQFFSLPQTTNMDKPLTSSFGKSKKPSEDFFHDEMFSTLQTFETTKEDKDSIMSFVNRPSLSEENVFSAVKGFSLEDMREKMAKLEHTPSLPPKPSLNQIFSGMPTHFGSSQKDKSQMTAFVHSSPSDLGNSLDDTISHFAKSSTFPTMKPFVHDSSLHKKGDFQSFFPPLEASLAPSKPPKLSAPLQPVEAVWKSQQVPNPQPLKRKQSATQITSTFSPFDAFSEEKSQVIGLELRRQIPRTSQAKLKQVILKSNAEETTTVSTLAYSPKTLYRKDTNKMKKKQQFKHFPKKTRKERRKKKQNPAEENIVEEENDRTSALKKLLSIAGPDWSKVEQPDR